MCSTLDEILVALMKSGDAYIHFQKSDEIICFCLQTTTKWPLLLHLRIQVFHLASSTSKIPEFRHVLYASYWTSIVIFRTLTVFCGFQLDFRDLEDFNCTLRILEILVVLDGFQIHRIRVSPLW